MRLVRPPSPKSQRYCVNVAPTFDAACAVRIDVFVGFGLLLRLLYGVDESRAERDRVEQPAQASPARPAPRSRTPCRRSRPRGRSPSRASGSGTPAAPPPGSARTSGRTRSPSVGALRRAADRTEQRGHRVRRLVRVVVRHRRRHLDRGLVAGAVGARAEVDRQLLHRPVAVGGRPRRGARRTRCRRRTSRRGSRGRAAPGRCSATRTSCCCRVASAKFCPVVQQLAAAVQPLGQRFWSAVENPLVSKLLLFPVKISTAL